MYIIDVVYIQYMKRFEISFALINSFDPQPQPKYYYVWKFYEPSLLKVSMVKIIQEECKRFEIIIFSKH